MSKWPRRLLVSAPIVVLAGAIGAPYLSAEHFKEQVRVNIEKLLRRKVEVQGEARFQLYPRPGVSLRRVLIHELPALGVEPIAYLDYPESSLDVSLSLLPLLLGRVKVTGVRLIAPSVNLTKSPDGGWTFQTLLNQTLGTASADGFDLDALEVRGGRLNIKIGNVKSVFYLADTDLRIEADPTSRSRYGITLEGDPARTDRTVSSFGRVSGRGMLTLGRGGEESRIELNLSIARTPISELVMALEGRSAGLGGFVASQARLSGPLSAVLIEGRLDLNEAERFGWLLPRGASAHGLGYIGRLDWLGQELRLSTRAAEPGVDPVSLRMRATDLFQQPHWAALLGISGAPLSSARALAGDLAIRVPSTLPLEGSLSGVLGYSSRYGTKGQLAVSDAAVPIPSLPPVKVATARFFVDKHRWAVPATELIFSERESLTVETGGDAASGAKQLTVASAGMPVEQSRQLWKFLAAGGDPPFFDRCRAGQWSGSIKYDQDAQGAGVWTGDVRVAGAVCVLDGVAEPAVVDSAQLSIRGPLMLARRIAARVAGLPVTGEVDHDPRLRRHTRLRLTAGEVSAAEIERMLLPALKRERGFLSRTLGRPVALPEWMNQRRLDGQVHLGALTLADQRLEGVDACIAWDGPTIDVTRFHAAFAGGVATGSMRVSLADDGPFYRGHLDLAEIVVRESRIDAGADWESRGVGTSGLLTALQAQGRFSAKGNPLLAAETVWESALGMFSFTGSRLQFSNLHLTAVGGVAWQGQGSAGLDGKLQLELTGGPESAARQLRSAGRFW